MDILINPFLSKTKTIPILEFLKYPEGLQKEIVEQHLAYVEQQAWSEKPWLARINDFSIQLVFRFANGFGLSVIYGAGTYGYPDSFEVGIIAFNADLTNYTLIYDYSDGDVIGYMTVEGVNEIIQKVKTITDNHVIVFNRAEGEREKTLENIKGLVASFPSLSEDADDETGIF